jgi:hypothetical protein
VLFENCFVGGKKKKRKQRQGNRGKKIFIYLVDGFDDNFEFLGHLGS